MAESIRMRCPDHARAISVGGTVYEADATAHVVVPAEHEAECRRHGFVRAPLEVPDDAPRMPRRGKSKADVPDDEPIS